MTKVGIFEDDVLALLFVCSYGIWFASRKIGHGDDPRSIQYRIWVAEYISAMTTLDILDLLRIEIEVDTE